ncbi:hypothetical protein [Klebsiella quasipneumoniae]|uniref:hypothetical protein n=1 Tax=Klebsiella quasipneumoniae TaxID=1463165 RepID=UPI0024049AA5|nr:hypothetical protein [Klebsiella quasipneumoniae]MDG0556556.1 hypothetical protein [Klebsiella quasipneumoniae]
MFYEDAIKREDAFEFLMKAYADFPEEIPYGLNRNVSERIFKDWRWVRTLDGEIVFANCLQQCISISDFNERKFAIEGAVWTL